MRENRLLSHEMNPGEPVMEVGGETVFFFFFQVDRMFILFYYIANQDPFTSC